MEKDDIIKRFLRKLVNLNIWGGRHTELANLKKCLPRHLRGEKITDEAIKEMISAGFLTLKLSTYEVHVSLNPSKKKEIYEFLMS